MDAAIGTSWWRRGSRANPRASTPRVVTVASSPRGSFWALLAFTFVIMIAPQFYFYWLIPLRLALTSFALAGGLYVLDRFSRGKPLIRLTQPTRIVIGLVLWAVATVPFSRWPGGSVDTLVNEFLKSVIVFWLVSEIVSTRQRFRTLLWTVTLFAIPVALTGIYNYVTGHFAGATVERIRGFEAPMTANPNDLALLLNLVLPLAISLLRTTHRGIGRALCLSVVVILTAGVVVTFSRAGFLGLALIIAMHAVHYAKEGKKGVALAIMAIFILAVPFLPGSYLQRLSLITNIDSDPTGSAQGRRQDIFLSLCEIARRPIIGSGIGMNILALDEARSYNAWKLVHNVYLQYGVDLGIPGLMMFVMLIIACIRGVRGVRRDATRERDLELARYADGAFVCLSMFAAVAVFYPVAYHFQFYYFGGIALALTKIGEPLQGPRIPNVSRDLGGLPSGRARIRTS